MRNRCSAVRNHTYTWVDDSESYRANISLLARPRFECYRQLMHCWPYVRYIHSMPAIVALNGLYHRNVGTEIYSSYPQRLRSIMYRKVGYYRVPTGGWNLPLPPLCPSALRASHSNTALNPVDYQGRERSFNYTFSLFLYRSSISDSFTCTRESAEGTRTSVSPRIGFADEPTEKNLIEDPDGCAAM